MEFKKPPHLDAFCRAMLEVILRKKGSGGPKWFLPRSGLCANYRDYLFYTHGIVGGDLVDAESQLYRMFQRNYGSGRFPFNGGIGDDFFDESNFGDTYKNPERLAFLKRWAAPEATVTDALGDGS